jgi:hypothetical protein
MSKASFVVTDSEGGRHEVITDSDEMARIQERLDKAREMNSVQLVKGERLRQSDVAHRCLCCIPSTPVFVSSDGRGHEQYTCLISKVTMRFMECRPLAFTDPVTGRTEYRDASTYVAGHIRLPG